jgi:MYXO-CTERM domain-containing protein
MNNIFTGGGTVSSQATALLTTNFTGSAPMFLDVANYDVHLMSGSPCIDMGTTPAAGMNPAFEYVQPLSEVARAVVGAKIDIGAYEYGLPADAGVIGPDGSPPDTGAGSSSGGGSGGGSSGGGSGGSSGGGSGGGSGSGSGGSSSGGSSGSGDGGSGNGASPGSSGGCGCDVAGAPGEIGLALGTLGLVAVAVRRRRRR